jgi:hypothetical protein
MKLYYGIDDEFYGVYLNEKIINFIEENEMTSQ